MTGNTQLQGWIAEYPSGRYAKAHYSHGSNLILVCMRGKGYSIAWPKEEGGITPWANGKGELVKTMEYIPGGLISAVPGPSTWFHQHFAYSQDPFRTFLFTGGVPGAECGRGDASEAGSESVQRSLTDIDKGGNAIPYYMEDPYIREYFTGRLYGEVLQLRCRLRSTRRPARPLK